MKNQQAPKAKDRTAAIIIAVFAGPVTWAYTYKKDKLKFWICMALYVLLIVAVIIVLQELYAEVDVGRDGANLESAETKTNWLLLAMPIGWAVWIWSIVDAIRRPDAWYQQYPNNTESK